MAGIDKTYVNKEQYLQIREWYINIFNKMKSDLGFNQWIYGFNCYDNLEITPELLKSNFEDIEYYENEGCLWNTGQLFDLWLLKNCPFDFIQSRLAEQYGDMLFPADLVELLNFDDKPYLEIIENEEEDVKLYLYEIIDDEYYTLDNILIYGNDKMLKTLHKVDKAFSCFLRNDELKGYKISFTFYDLEIEFRDNNFYHDNKLIYLPKFKFEKINIKQSFNISDSKDYQPFEIFISSDESCFDLSQIENYSKDKIGKYLMIYLPEHLSEYIKINSDGNV